MTFLLLVSGDNKGSGVGHLTCLSPLYTPFKTIQRTDEFLVVNGHAVPTRGKEIVSYYITLQEMVYTRTWMGRGCCCDLTEESYCTSNPSAIYSGKEGH